MFSSTVTGMNWLVRSDCRRHPGALLGVEGLVDDRPVREGGLAVGVGDGQRVLAPVLACGLLRLAFQRLLVVQLVESVREVLSAKPCRQYQDQGMLG